MKKLMMMLAMVLMVSMVLVGCGSNANNEVLTEVDPVEEVVESEEVVETEEEATEEDVTEEEVTEEETTEEVEAQVYTPGVYQGEGEGYKGAIIVEVTINEEGIESIEIVEFGDSDFAVETAENMIALVIEANSANVDAIAGATATSNGVLEAIQNALDQAAAE